MLIFNNNAPIKQKQWINTKVEFEWSEELQKYVEISTDGYWYDGDMALCAFNETGESTMKAAGTGDYVALAIWGDNNISSGNNWGSLDLYRGISGTNTLIGRFSTSYNDISIQAQNSRNIRIHDDAGKGIFVEEGGNVYIGAATTPNPDCHLTIDGDNGTGYGIHTTGDIKIIKSSARILVGENTSGGGFGSLTWNHTDNTLCLGTEAGGETSQVVLDGSGRVGIGATTPSTPLYVKHATSGSIVIHSNNDTAGTMSTLYFKSVNTTEANNGQRQKAAIIFEGNGTGEGPGLLHFCVDTAADTGNVGLAESRMVISGSNVGIGTASPSGILQLSQANDGGDTQFWLVNSAAEGSADESASIVFGTTPDTVVQNMGQITAGREQNYSSSGNRDSYISFSPALANSNTERMRITSAGKVGIGTTAPGNYHDSSLVLYKASSNYFTIASDAGSTTSILFSDGTSGDAQYEGQIEYVHASDEFRIHTSATRAMTIDSSQNVIFSKANAKISGSSTSTGSFGVVSAGGNPDLSAGGTGQLQAIGGKGAQNTLLKLNSNSSNKEARIFFTDATNWSTSIGAATDGDFVVWANGTSATEGTDVFHVERGGSVGIGTASPGYKLEVNGTFYSAGSSVAYKENIEDLEIDSSLIHNLRPVSYDYKKEYEHFGYNVSAGKQLGLLSEEVAETIPELAIMKDGKPKNVDYEKLSVILLTEVQNLKKEIEELKK